MTSHIADIPHGQGISGDGLARGYSAGFLIYPNINIWEWCRG